MLLDDLTKPAQELMLFKKAGCNSFLEMSPKHYGRNVMAMVAASKESEVNVVATTGFICQKFLTKKIDDLSVNQIADFLISEVEEGMDGTTHKAGVIKAGTSYNYITSTEEKIFKAAVIASRKTGASISTHTTHGTMGVQQVELVVSEGLDPSKLILSHLDHNPDYAIHKKINSMGAYIVHDNISKTKYMPDSEIIDLLRRLTADGYADKNMLSIDMGRRSYWTSYGGGPGFTYIPTIFTKRLLEEGFSQEIVDKFTTHNPAEAFAIVN